MVEVRRAEMADAAWLAPRLRPADIAEARATHGDDVDLLHLVRTALIASDQPLAAVVDGEVFALFGCAPVSLLTGEGAPWMMGSAVVDRQARAAVVIGRAAVATWQRRYRTLLNWVDARNTRSVRWLARIGFTIHPAEPRGAAGLPFHLFTRCA